MTISQLIIVVLLTLGFSQRSLGQDIDADPDVTGGCAGTDVTYDFTYNGTGTLMDISWVLESPNDGTLYEQSGDRALVDWWETGSIIAYYTVYYPQWDETDVLSAYRSFDLIPPPSGTITVGPEPTTNRCYGGSGTFSITGDTGTVTWQKCVSGCSSTTDAGWTTTTNSFTNLTTATQFRAKMSNACAAAYSNTITMTVDQPSVAGTIMGAAESYGVASGQLTATGFTGTVQGWWTKNLEGFWMPVNNSNSTLAYTNIMSTTKYFVDVKNGACPLVSSAEVEIKIYPVPSLAIQGESTIAPGGSTTLVTDAGFYSYEWFRNNVSIHGESSVNLVVSKPGNYKLSVKSNATAPTYTTGNLVIGEAFGDLSPSMNYILTTTLQKEGITLQTDLYELEVKDISQMVQYFDGLGRRLQTVTVAGSPLGKDIVQPFIYDAFGRDSVQYLRYARTIHSGRYSSAGVIDQGTFYQTADRIEHDTAPFAMNLLESSPRNRILKQGAPGEVWQPDATPLSMDDRSVKMKYETNAEGEVLLFAYELTTDKIKLSDDISDRYYEPNQLFANKTYDEHNNEMIEYVDKEGKTVCKKVQYASEEVEPGIVRRLYACTYYVYDDLGNLVAVVPPEATKRLLDISN